MTSMKRLRLSAAGVAMAVALGTAAYASQRQAPPAQDSAATSASAWAQARSDVPADPNVRFGVLPNGMRYAIQRNATPPNNASIRLRIDAGSIHEAEDQRGLAHFLEHLTLNETRNVPEGELIRILERAGLRFGPDTNAFTGFDQTGYMLDLPRTDAQTIDTALFLMREVAGEATLSQGAIDRERGIILSEERSRATPQLRLIEDSLKFVLRGDVMPNRLPIGTTQVINTAPRQRFVDFYNAYYRPERATLIAVGDFDVAEMEAKIRQRFGDWRGRGRPGADPAPARISPRQTETRVFVEPGVPTQVTMNWIKPLDEPDTRAERAEEILEALGLAILNRRMERLARGDNPPFIAGAGLLSREGERVQMPVVVGVAQAGGWQRALQTVEQEHRRALQHGFTQAELDREINEMRTSLTNAAAGAATRTSPDIAMALLTSVNQDRVFTAPATNLELFNQATAGLTAARVNEAFRALFSGGEPLIHLSSPQPVEGGDAAVRTAFNASRQVAVAPPAVQQAATWPYTDFGAPGQVAERREIADIGATAVRFANGVRLTVKPTNFRDDEVQVAARFEGGLLAQPAGRSLPVWALPLGAFASGGLGRLSFEDMQQVLTGKVYSTDATVQEDAVILSGRTRPEDFPTQLQVLAAYTRDPAFRAPAWDRLRAFSGTLHDQLQSTPTGVFQRDSGALLRSGDQRWGIPTREEIAGSDISALRQLFAPALASAPLEVIVVGDISVDEAIAQVGRTFGALPARPASNAAAPAAGAVRFPAPGAVTRTHGGRADQGLAFIAWPTADFYSDQRRSRGLSLLSRVLQLRLTEKIREEQGASYSPAAAHSPSDAIQGYGYMLALMEAPPQALDAFYRDAQAIARDLRERPISADELERARRPMLESMQRNRTSNNQWWVQQLAGVQTRPERVESIRVSIDQVNSFTPQDLQRLAQQYLVDERSWRFSAVPPAQ